MSLSRRFFSSSSVTLFDRIVRGELPCSKLYEDALILAFRDVHPIAPVHLLVVPKDRDGLDKLSSATDRHRDLLGHMMVKAGHIASLAGVEDFRLVVNNGGRAGQSVFHLHLHIIGGESCAFKWPPV